MYSNSWSTSLWWPAAYQVLGQRTKQGHAFRHPIEIAWLGSDGFPLLADMRMTRRTYAHLLRKTVAKSVPKHLPSFDDSAPKGRRARKGL